MSSHIIRLLRSDDPTSPVLIKVTNKNTDASSPDINLELLATEGEAPYVAHSKILPAPSFAPLLPPVYAPFNHVVLPEANSRSF